MSLNYIEINQLSDLKVVIDSSILITGSALLKDDEITMNMWCIFFDDKVLESFSQEQFEEFITALVNKKKQQIAEMYKSVPATFYMWFDEQTSQLRFNIVSGHIEQLPFGCIVEIINSVESIYQELKKSYSNQGISWAELEFFEDDEGDTEDDQEYTLQVYVQKI